MSVVSEVGTADEAVSAAARLQPRVVLMDIDMPGRFTFEAGRTIGTRCPDTAIVFVSAFSHDRYIEQAIAIEAMGYVTKDEPLDKLIEAIRRVARGVAYYSPEIQSRIVVDPQGARLANQGQTRLSRLSPRETEVLRYLARGLSKKQIAGTMHLSVNTVVVHTTNIMKKLDIHDRVELARFAIREGLAEA